MGYACATLARDRAQFAQVGHYRAEGGPFVDETQGIAGLFLIGSGPRIELLKSLAGRKTLDPWMAQSTKVYHFAYEVPDMAVALASARAQRAITTVQPMPTVAFGGRQVAFVMLRNGWLLEFIELAWPHSTMQ